MFEALHLLRPWWLLALLPLAILLIWLWRRRGAQGDWAQHCDPELMEALLQRQPGKTQRGGLLLLALAWISTVVALAGPVWQELPQPVLRSTAARVLVLDLSKSMDATDIKPSRLKRAQRKAVDLLRAATDGQTGLVVFAGTAFAVAPLSDDANTLATQISTFDTRLLPEQGGDLQLALAKAQALLEGGKARGGVVWLLTDSTPNESAFRQATSLAQAGHVLQIIGFGTQAGAPVALPQGGYLKDSSGAIVLPRLEEAALRRLAQAGGGAYRPTAHGDADVQALLEAAAPSVNDVQLTARQTDQWVEEGPWLLLLVLPLAALGFRRGLLVLVVAIMVLPPPAVAAPAWWDSLWQRDEQRAQALLEAGKPAAAVELFAAPERRETAAYRAEDWDAAAREFAQADNAAGHYNRGNALARAGKLDEGIKAYDAALKLDPQLEDAAANKALVEQLQQQQEQQQDQQSDERDKQDQEQQDQEQKDQQQEQQNQDGASEQDQQQGGQPSPQPGESPAPSPSPAPAQGESSPAPSPSAAPQPELQPVGTPPPDDEEEEARQQWLRRIDDDPGAYWRNKFRLEQGRQYGDYERDDSKPAW